MSYHIFSKKKICQEMEGHFSVKELKSKKWSEVRFNNELEKIMGKGEFRCKHETKVNLEPMGTDANGNLRPARILISGGDDGLIMTLLTVGIKSGSCLIA